MDFQNLELDAILSLTEDQQTEVKNEISRFTKLVVESLQVGKISKGAVNLVRDAGYEYNLFIINDNSFFVEHLYNIASSNLEKLRLTTDGKGVILKVRYS